ncbi:PIN domain-containing protein [Patescibacteria group bacterium]|nr:type II toxin-antitoxin system VapC family toxin [Candidatus Falkowbacteria bacterium]MBU3905554.1 PIN domain-containing protein [Patescibacteria group bacterium]MCG2698737.1 PIN domain-containing protein [Candidatus Parcubacteria bacterium]MBU4015666.1 PIN domain-containing protein [Patescibacteria group bacterium]MBU4026238.1 PIN domain-containing protein [Patescibacteria group bacterium]
MKIYLDTNIYYRGFDDQSQPRIHLESQAILTIFNAIEKKIIHLSISDILLFEISRGSKIESMQIRKSLLKLASIHIKNTKIITKQTKNITDKFNVLPADAMHLSSAQSANVDFFITCDDILIKKANRFHQAFPFVIMNPTNFILSY